MQFTAILLAFVATSVAVVLPRQAALTCGIANLQCCGTLALASEPIVANSLGLEGLTIPGAGTTVGLNCTTPVEDGTPVTSQCIGILSCCTTIGMGNNTDISEDCTMAGLSTKRDVQGFEVSLDEILEKRDIGLFETARSLLGM